MNCPSCNSSKCKVIASRPITGDRVRRRRRCLVCGHRWSTLELTVDAVQELGEHRTVEAQQLAERITAVLETAPA